MLVGILSMQQVDNYGSYWQAVSLKEMLESLGCQVGFIDIMPGRKIVEDTYHKKFAWNKIRRIPYYMYARQRRQMFCDVRSKTFAKIEAKQCNAVVIGSDEVFNCKQPSSWGFSTQLYGNVECSKVLTYAASFGYTNYEFIISKNIASDMTKALSKLSSISVRDNNSKDIIWKLLGLESEIHLDPVLLNTKIGANQPIKNKPLESGKRYILIYSYDFRLCEEEYIKEIKRIAKKNKLILLSAGFYQQWVDKNVNSTPTGILSLFKNAEYVITDTFHGTIFSIKYHKRFATVIRNSNTQKLSDLLSRVSLTSHSVKAPNDLEKILNKEPRYDEIEAVLLEQRNLALDYLRHALYENEE